MIVKAAISLNKGTTTKVRVGCIMSDRFSVKVRVHQGSLLSLLLFQIVMNVMTKNARNGVLHEILYADYLIWY